MNDNHLEEVTSVVSVLFPKGPHTTETIIDIRNVDTNQLFVAIENLKMQVKASLKQAEQQAQMRGIVVPLGGKEFPKG